MRGGRNDKILQYHHVHNSLRHVQGVMYSQFWIQTGIHQYLGHAVNTPMTEPLELFSALGFLVEQTKGKDQIFQIYQSVL